jgi:hypothetical protein
MSIQLKVWNVDPQKLCAYNVGTQPKYADVGDSIVVVGDRCVIVFTDAGMHSYCVEFDSDIEAEAFVTGGKFDINNLEEWDQID